LLCPENVRLTAAEALNHPWFELNLPDVPIHKSDFAGMKKFAQQDKLKKVSINYISRRMPTDNAE
jgi:hypothetical protein